MQWYQKQKNFRNFFLTLLKSTLNLKDIPKKKTRIADVYPEIPDAKNMVRKMSKAPCFRRPLDRENGKCVETLLRYEWQHLYNIY